MSPLIESTLQAATLSAVSNILAQSIKCYQAPDACALDLITIFHFVLFALVSTPPNFLWQQTLEAWYPSHVPGEKGDKKLSGKNTLAKFAVDQALGGPVNTVLFLSAMAWMRGTEVAPFVVKEFLPLTLAGLKLWPAVSFLGFALVPAEKRVVFGSLVALGWNVYLGMVMG